MPPDTDDLRSLVRTWTFILIGAGIWMLGYYLPTYRLVYAIPIIGNVRCPARMVLAVDMALAVLAAVAAHVVAQARANSGFRNPDSGTAVPQAPGPFSRRRNGDEGVAVQSEIENRQSAIARVVFRLAAFALPVTMFLFLALIHGVALASKHWKWFGEVLNPLWGQLLVGGPDDLLAATKFSNPAVYVPAVLAFLTVGFLWFVIPTRRRAKWPLLLFAAPVALVAGPLWFIFRRPGRRVWMLVWLILLDLFILARFVDVPAEPDPARDAELSPVAKWLAENGPKEPYRVLAIGRDYHGRAGELLLPKVSGLHNVESISYYGPLGPREHAWLFGFRPWGENYQLEWLLRTNHLLSLYNVRYLILEDWPATWIYRPPPPESANRQAWFMGHWRDVMEEVRLSETPGNEGKPVSTGSFQANLLGRQWKLQNGAMEGGILRVQASSMTQLGGAAMPIDEQKINLLMRNRPGEDRLRVGVLGLPFVELSLEVRAPKGAGGPAWAEVRVPWLWDGLRLRVDSEQLSDTWRQFRVRGMPCTSSQADSESIITISTQSTLPIEFRNIRLEGSMPWQPLHLGGRLDVHEPVYEKRTVLPNARFGDPTVVIYENMLCLPRRFPVKEVVWLPDNVSVIDELRYHADKYDLTKQVLMAGPPRDIQVKEFVSENPAAPGLGPHLPANGLGSVILADGSSGAAAAGGAEQRAGTVPAWSLFVSAVGILTYLGLAMWARMASNRR